MFKCFPQFFKTKKYTELTPMSHLSLGIVQESMAENVLDIEQESMAENDQIFKANDLKLKSVCF